jgi:hypothetical protein
MVGNKRGKRISNCAPAIGQCEQHHAAIRGKSSSVMAGVAVRRDARRVVSTPIPYASSMLCATPFSTNPGPPE